ncbi:MAG TPA: hypothetical protein VLL52_21560 [Anaerolineae bacterium]|nr:hypothetical protein [Anaerolineae bacterium]
MSYSICVEDSGGDCLSIRHSGQIRGNELVDFLSLLDGFCHGFAPEEIEILFKQLADRAPVSLCKVTKTLRISYHTDSLRYYTEEDYALYNKRNHLSLSEEEFVTAFNEFHIMSWYSLKELTWEAYTLMRLLTNIKVESSDIYRKEATIIDLEALIDTLEFFEKRGAEQVRLIII